MLTALLFTFVKKNKPVGFFFFLRSIGFVYYELK